MLSISIDDALDYCTKGNNILEAAVGFVVTGTGSAATIAFTDLTTYASGEARAAVNITVYDHFGGKKELQIKSGATASVTADMTNLNPTDGLDAIATVVSDQGNIKDGSVHDLINMRTSGNFVMEI
jgi:hypothetical protein